MQIRMNDPGHGPTARALSTGFLVPAGAKHQRREPKTQALLTHPRRPGEDQNLR
jgi:hypothetical protein